jgi:Tol biopolymer transport system component
VAIPAVVGDTIETAMLSGSGTVSVVLSPVPVHVVPVVVRTRPRKGRTAVPINFHVGIIFSEPLDPASVTAGSVQLLRGAEPVPTTLQLRPDGLAVELFPGQLLDHETEYTIVVTTEVRDLSGDRPETSFTSSFTTAPREFRDKIAFQSNRAGPTEIYVMNSDGSDVARLTYEVIGGPSSVPAVSPDGRRVAFSVRVDGPAGPEVEFEVYVMNVDGTGLTNLSRNPAVDWGPAWSPDGSKIAFVSGREGDPEGAEIYVMNADGTGQMNLSNSPGWDSNPAWSPDGTRIAFASARDGSGEIYVMSADGTGVTRLTDPGIPGSTNFPAWSPDGSKIAFVRSLDIYLMNPDGTGAVNLTAGRAFPTDTPAWSPDGSRIAFVSGQSGGRGIYVMNTNGTGITQISDGPGDSWPSWSP